MCELGQKNRELAICRSFPRTKKANNNDRPRKVLLGKRGAGAKEKEILGWENIVISRIFLPNFSSGAFPLILILFEMRNSNDRNFFP